jgi:hypothetical protein
MEKRYDGQWIRKYNTEHVEKKVHSKRYSSKLDMQVKQC